jgi:hypothetical protein
MDASVEVLEKYGLAADEDSFRVLDLERKKVFKLHRELYESIFSRQQESPKEDIAIDPPRRIRSSLHRATPLTSG